MEKNKKKLKINLVRLNGDDSGHSCGYCKNSETGVKNNTSFSFGFSTDYYPVEIYEDMMFSGWRRCGDYTYKPNLFKSCCKSYSCRLNVEKYKMNKEQKKVLKKFEKYLNGYFDENNKLIKEEVEEKKPVCDNYLNELQNVYKSFIDANELKDILNKYNITVPKNQIVRNQNRKNGDYSTNILITIKNQLKKNKIEENQISNIITNIFKIFENIFNSIKEKYLISLCEKTFHINLTVINKEEYNKFYNENYKIEKKQNKKEEEKKTKEPKGIKHKYTFELTDKYEATKEKIEIYAKYQMKVHKDKEEECTIERYNRAWGESNLISEENCIKLPENLKEKTENPEIFPKKYGTYNFLHKIDNKIIAVGVWDILPTSLSSVYLYYDPDYSFLDLGTLTAIKEIEYIKKFHDLIDNKFKYYVMGFYIDNCVKMRYKGEFHPTEILDPFSLNFVDLDNVRDIIKDNKCHKLSNEKTRSDFIQLNNDEINAISNSLTINYKGKKINFNSFVDFYIIERYRDMIKNQLKRFLSLIGKKIYETINFIVDFN